MAVLEIRKVPDPVLRAKAKPVKKVGPSVRQLAEDMVETMYAAHGVGLAANQVGVLRRILVADPQPDGGHDLHILINPVIYRQEGREVATEGCLSVPDSVGDVPRATRILVRALDLSGRSIWLEAEGYLARIIQHEVDHLDGILFLDRALSVRRTGGEEAEAAPEPESDASAEVSG